MTSTIGWEILPKFDYYPLCGCRPRVLKMPRMGPAVRVADTQFAIIQFESQILRILLYDSNHRSWKDLFTLAQPCNFIIRQGEISLAFVEKLFLFCSRKRVMYIMNMSKSTLLRVPVGNESGDSTRYRYARISVFDGHLCMVASIAPDNFLIYRAWNRNKCDFDDIIILSRTLALKDFALHTDANSIWIVGGRSLIRGVYPSAGVTGPTHMNSSSIHQFIRTNDQGFLHKAHNNLLPHPMTKATIGSYPRFRQFLICGSYIGIWQGTRSLDIMQINLQNSNILSCDKMQCALPVPYSCSAVILFNPAADIKTVSGFIRKICPNGNFPPAYLLHYICSYYVNAYLHIICQLSGNHYRCQLD